MTPAQIKKAVVAAIKSGNWFIRVDRAGQSYGGFQWKGIGEWTEAPDWNPETVCGGGLHYQGPEASGFRQSGADVSFGDTDGPRVVIGGDKAKSPRARALLRNDLSAAKGLSVGGRLSLSGCTGLTALPEGMSVGSWLILAGCTGLTALPEGLSVGGSLDLAGCTGLTSLPDGLSVGSLDLSGCTGLTAHYAFRRGRIVRGKATTSATKE